MKIFFVIVIILAVTFFVVYNTIGLIKTFKERKKKKNDTNDGE